MATPISDDAHPKIIEITFSFSELTPACKLSVHSINSLRYSQFQSHVTRLAKPIFWPCPPRNILINFISCELVSTCKKSGYFIDLLWRYGWLKNEIDLQHFTKVPQICDLCRNTANYINFHYRRYSVKINDQIFQ